MIGVIAAHQIRSLRRQHIFVALLGMFLGMTAVAGLLGWSSHNTIIRVYQEAVNLLASTGKAAPPNPYLLKPELSQFSNMVVYIPLLGALLALVLGHLALADDEANGLGRLIFSRRVSRATYLTGKIVGAAVVIGAILLVGFLVSWASLALIDRSWPAAENIRRLALFYGLSSLYVMVFALVGMVTALATGRRSLALLSAIGVWLVITFAVPQLTSGLRPVASLNPVVEPVSTSQELFQITALARPYSIAEQYKQASGQILATITPEPVGQTIRRVLPIVGLLAILVLVAFALIQRHDFSRASSGE